MGALDVLLEDLKTLFEVREFVSGKVDMQKSLYFMKELGYKVPGDFRWSKLGPYSFELDNLIERMTLQGYLKYTGRYEMSEKASRFIKPNATDTMTNFFQEMEKIWNKKNYDQVAFIECAASLHFLYKNSRDRQKKAIFSKLTIIKPERMDAFEPLIENAWDFLERQNLLQ
jgi:uncharacterized protein YwgA